MRRADYKFTTALSPCLPSTRPESQAHARGRAAPRPAASDHLGPARALGVDDQAQAVPVIIPSDTTTAARCLWSPRHDHYNVALAIRQRSGCSQRRTGTGRKIDPPADTARRKLRTEGPAVGKGPNDTPLNSGGNSEGGEWFKFWKRYRRKF